MAGNKNSGRPAKSTAMLKLHGNFRDDRHAERFDDSTLAPEIATPALLSETEAKCWDEIIPDLQAAGYVKRIDSTELRGMIEWLARYRVLIVWLRDRQSKPEVDVDEVLKIQGMAQKAWTTFFTIAGRFGLSPSDRSKLGTEHKPKQSDFDKEIVSA